MKRSDFFSELKDILMIDDDLNENSEIHLTSLSILSIIAFLDENFDRHAKASDIRNINSVADLINLIGKEHIT